MRVWCAGALMMLAAAQAAAGAWPRPPGSGFVSVGFEVATSRSALSPSGLETDPSPDFTGYRTLYAEFGITPRLTFGLDIGQDDADTAAWAGRQMTGTMMGLPTTDGREDDTDWPIAPTWSGVGFARWALSAPEDRHQFAVSLGIGARTYEKQGLFFGLETIEREPILRAAAAWGMGFDSRFGPGWLGLDGSVEQRADTGGRAIKLDAMAGVKPEGRYTYMLGLQTGEFPGSEPFARLVPGLVVQVRDGLSLETTAIWGLHGNDIVGTKLAVWFEW